MESFFKSLTNYLLGTSEELIVQRAGKLINKCENQEFDITFPSASKLDIWKKCIGKHENEIRFDGLMKVEQDSDYVTLSQYLPWPVTRILSKNDKVFLKLDRQCVIKSIVTQVYLKGVISQKHDCAKTVSIVNSELVRNVGKCSSNQLTQLRTNQIFHALRRLLSVCDHDIVPTNEANYVLKIGCSDVCHLKKHKNDIPLKIGQVKIKSNGDAKEYYNMTGIYKSMCNKMLAIANERDCKGSMQDVRMQTKMIASAELQIMFFARNMDRSININNFEDDGNVAKEGTFILYNYARMNQLLESFEVQRKNYGNMMAIEEVDFSFLKEPEEWDIIVNGVIPYIETIATISDIKFNEIDSNETLNRCLHRICTHVSKLSNIYSKYYRRVKVLKEGLQGTSADQTLSAKLYFIRAIKLVYDHAFYVLGIVPVKYM